ncbi:phage major capsid protein [Micromonospora sp. MA102]|uniref:phage major capsid protein n=1 Tax=Micromonospora sp. MA102 TaxID=2952755 RepID=UPI0021C5DC68|nr:phage major capsid protein [Micromonospora sp. MA102]
MARTIQDVMAEHKAAKERGARLVAEMETIADIERDLTPGERERLDRIQRGVDRAIAEANELDAEWRQMVVDGGPGIRAVRGVPGDDYPERSPRAGERDQALRQIERSGRAGYLADHAAERATALVERFGSQREQSLAARWVTVAGDDHYRSAFAKLLGDPTRGHLMWTEREREAYQRVAELQSEMRAMSVGTVGAGGYMVPMTLDPALNISNAGSINPLRRISRVVQTVTNSWTGLNSAGATAEWLGADNTAREAADGSPTINDEPIPAYFGDVFTPYSYELGMDAVDFLGELTRVLVDAADVHQAAAYVTGSGVNQPTGFTVALTGTPSVVATAGADTLVAGDVFNLQNQLPPRFQGRAQWCANLAIINSLRQMETTNGALKFPELANGQLLGRPINECSDMDGTLTAAANNFILAYGDWTQFVIVDRIGATLEVIPNLVGANRRPTGQRGAFLWYRTGSDVLVDNAFRLLNA